MSAFENCIRSAQASGKIKQKKADEALGAFADAVAEGLASGLSEGAARVAAGMKAMETMGARTKARKWEKLNELRKQHELYQRMMASTDEVQLLIDFGDEVDLAAERNLGWGQTEFSDFIERSRPKMAGIIHPVKHLDDIVRASYGAKTQLEAKEMADSIENLKEFYRKMANNAGASIPENKNARLLQSHSTIKVRRIEKTIDESKKRWINDHLRTLDWNVMEYHGEKIPVHKREEVLGKVFDTIASFGDANIQPGIPNQRLTERLAAQRFLYYKDADSWIEMNKLYGEGNLFEQTIGMMEGMSRTIALMEKFGPNPAASVNFVLKAAKSKAAEQSLAPGLSTKKKTPSAKVDKAISDFIERYKFQSRNLANSDESTLAVWGGNIRTVVTTSILSSSFIANLGDFSQMKHVALMNKLPYHKHTRTAIEMFIPNKANRQMALRAGLGMESAINMASSLQRLVGPLEGSAWAKRMSDTMFRVQLLTPLTQAMKWSSGVNTMGVFADMKGARFADLPMVDEWRARGITEEDWELFRAQPIMDENGYRLLAPIDLYNKGGVRNQRVAQKFMDYVLDIQKQSVISADSRALTTLGHTADPRTWRGQLWKSSSMFMSFSSTILLNHIRRAVREATWGGKLRHTASLAIHLTIAGAFITQMKELAKGRDPLDMDPTSKTGRSFWFKAMLNGGSFGLLGDAILGPGSLTDMAAGANVRFLQDVKTLAQAGSQRIADLISGEKLDPALERNVVKMFGKYTPWVWQVRLIVDRMMLDEALRLADQQAYKRLKQLERRREKELGQKAWWGVGESSPSRMPDFGAAFGGSR